MIYNGKINPFLSEQEAASAIYGFFPLGINLQECLLTSPCLKLLA